MMKTILGIFAFLLLLLLLFTEHPVSENSTPSKEGQTLIGTKAKAWEVGHWLHSDPIRLEDP